MRSEAIVSRISSDRRRGANTVIALTGGLVVVLDLPDSKEKDCILVPHDFDKNLVKRFNEDWESNPEKHPVRLSPCQPDNWDYQDVLAVDCDVTVISPCGKKWQEVYPIIQPDQVIAIWSDTKKTEHVKGIEPSEGAVTFSRPSSS
ncbi:MAG: hypothetical protein ACIAQ0_00370 [Phycisphaerales bacterium JB058]